MNSIDFYKGKCVICMVKIGVKDKKFCQDLTSVNWNQIKTCSKQRYLLGDTEFRDCFLFTEKYGELDGILELGLKFKKQCYQKLTNITLIKRLEESIAAAVVVPVVVHDNNNDASMENIQRADIVTRTRVHLTYDKDNCILCNEAGGHLHNITTQSMCLQMREIHDRTNDVELKSRLNPFKFRDDPLIGVTLDVKYHKSCLNKKLRQVDEGLPSTTKSCDDYELAQMELVSAIRSALSEPEMNLDLTSIKTTFIEMLKLKNLPKSEPTNKTVKEIIKLYFPEVQIFRPPQRNKPDYICTGQPPEKKRLDDEFDIVLKAAMILRKAILDSTKWTFTGTFEDYHEIPLLYSFFHHVISGTVALGKTLARDKQMDRDTNLLCQHIKTKIRTGRQLRYAPRDSLQPFRSSIETPITIGLPLLFHMDCRSRDITNNLADLDLGVSYFKLMQLEANLANSVSKRSDSSGGYCLPPWATRDSLHSLQ